MNKHLQTVTTDTHASKFAAQLTKNSCAAAAIQNGLLLGNLYISQGDLARMLDCEPGGADGDKVTDVLCQMGFKPQYIEKPREVETGSFFRGLKGAFVLACIDGGGHWVTLSKWHPNIEMISSSTRGCRVRTMTYTGFDELDWEDCVQVVRPGKWEKNYARG